jgi:hypothetical protein
VVYDPAEPRKVYDLADSNKPAGATTFKGIAVISHRAASTFDALIKGNHGFSPGDPVDTLTQGDIWVKTESPVTVGNTAYYRTTAVTDKPLGGLTDTQAAEVTEIAGSQWIKVESDLAVLNLGGF